MDEVLTPRALDAARGRTDFLTLGVDLNDASGKRKMDRKPRGTHAELVAIVDVERGEPVRWAGKSYPVDWREGTLVQEAHLNMFSKRVSSAMTPRSRRHRRSEEMKELARTFAPTMILHHLHSTDWWRVWSTAWSGARDLARTVLFNQPVPQGGAEIETVVQVPGPNERVGVHHGLNGRYSIKEDRPRMSTMVTDKSEP